MSKKKGTITYDVNDAIDEGLRSYKGNLADLVQEVMGQDSNPSGDTSSAVNTEQPATTEAASFNALQNTESIEQSTLPEKVTKPEKTFSKDSLKKGKENVDKPDGNKKIKKSDEAAVAHTDSEPVTTQITEVKKADNTTRQRNSKKDGKSKKDTKKKDRHKPLRRVDIDLDSDIMKQFFVMRMSGKDLQKVYGKAAKCHMSTSTYGRETLLNSVPRALTDDERKDMKTIISGQDDVNFHIRQMHNHFHSMLLEKDKEGKEKYDRETWKELKEVIKKQKELQESLDKIRKIYNIK